MRVGGGIYNYPGALTFLIETQNLYKENHTKPNWQARGGEHCESLPGLTGWGGCHTEQMPASSITVPTLPPQAWASHPSVTREHLPSSHNLPTSHGI